uniref:kelch-like protein 12 n=1 Tax=Styela clava TaxID=7725 RepID=UPI00193A2057|nr:kelch-like protein 12 [Styela clava]
MECDLGIDINEHNASMMERLDFMRKEKQSCDFIIKVGEEKFHVDKKIMMAASDYFVAMFSHNTLESSNGIVEMKDVNEESVKICIDYIYTGKASITLEKSEQLLHVATLMQLSVLCDKIAEFLKAKLNPESFFNIRRISIKYCNQALKKFCDDFALSNLGAIAKKKDQFNHLDVEYILFLVGPDNVGYSEDSKMAIFLHWIKFDIDNRGKYFTDNISNQKMSQLSAGYTSYLVENESICSESAEFLKKAFLKLSVKIGVKSSSVRIPDSVSLAKLFVFDKTSKSVQTFDPEDKSWTKLHNMNEKLIKTEYTAASLNGYLYVMFSNCKVQRINIMEINSTWMICADLIKKHGAFMRSVVHSDNIYVCGDNWMETCNPAQNEWTSVPTNSIPCNECALVSCKDLLFVIGGKDSSEKKVNTVNKYSPSTSTWTRSTPMKIQRQSPGATASDGKIFVVGGYAGPQNYISDMECYNVLTDTWITLSSLTIPRDNFALCLINDKLYAVGGEKSSPQTIECYNISNNSWKVIEKMTNMVIRASASVESSQEC